MVRVVLFFAILIGFWAFDRYVEKKVEDKLSEDE